MKSVAEYKERIGLVCLGEPQEVWSVAHSLIEEGVELGITPRTERPAYSAVAGLCNAAVDLSDVEADLAEIIDSMPWDDDMTSEFLLVYLNAEQSVAQFA